MKKINRKISALTLAFAMLFSMNVMAYQVEANDLPPSITFTYDDLIKEITITSADSGYHYSDSSSGDNANLIFVRDNDTFYHYVGGNMSVVTSGAATTEGIYAGDIISGFSEGWWSIYWKPYGSGYSYMSFYVSEESSSPPGITFSYDDSTKQVTVTSADSDLHYSDTSSSSDANLVFVRSGETFHRYVGSNMRLVTSEPLSTKEIEAGDKISISQPGTYDIYWKSFGSGYSYYTFIVTYDGLPPSMGFFYDDSTNQVTITSTDSGYYYGDSPSWYDANLIFVRDNDTFYHYVGANMTVMTSGAATTEEIYAGDIISGFSEGWWNVQWKPYGSGYSYMSFYVSESPPSQTGWIYGIVLGTTENGTFSLGGALISVILGNGTAASTYTNQDGEYDVSVAAGTYSVRASKDGYITVVCMMVEVDENEGTEVNFNLSEQFHDANVGYIYGTVFVKSGNSTIPLANATVSYKYLRNETNGSYQLWRVKFTDGEGNYLIELLPDVYELRAGRMRPSSPIEMVEVNANEKIRLDFILDEGTTGVEGKPVGIVNNTMILDAIQNGSVGGEITIWQNVSNKIEHEVMIYNGVMISNLEAEQENISFIISGDEGSSGKTIAITTDLYIFDITANLVVKYDGEIIKMANSISDVLNPNDDGIHAEYIITIGTDGIEILISIPHFSEHEITISTLQPEGPIDEIVESVGGINAIMLYLSICIVASVLFIGTIYMRRKL